jgi:hypothetical protein
MLLALLPVLVLILVVLWLLLLVQSLLWQLVGCRGGVVAFGKKVQRVTMTRSVVVGVVVVGNGDSTTLVVGVHIDSL